jgi:predicted dehydrogenase
MSEVLRVGMVGYAFMGAAHAQAWRNAHRFFDLPLTPELTSVAGRSPEAVSAAAERLGFASIETEWRRLVERTDIDLIDICTPGDSHAEIAIAALQTGKHVLCEKPLANTVEEAEQMAAAASSAAERGVWAMCGFTYRRTPALALARQLVEAGRIGTVRQVRAQYLQDWLHDPDAPMTWRLDKSKSGSGALGDLGAHLVDTALWLTGQEITGVSAILETFVKSRPLSGERAGLGGHGDSAADAPRGEVTVDDAALFTARFAGGATGVFEATRFAPGRKNALRIEINGTDGSLAFDFEENNLLQFFDGTESVEEQGFRRILATRTPVRERLVAARARPRLRARVHPPGRGPGHRRRRNRQPEPSFDDGLRVQRILGAVEASAGRYSAWTTV